MAGFHDLADRLAELEGIPSRMAREVADGINVRLQEEFDAGQNAYGSAWKPLLPQTVRRKGGDTRILRRTDGLSSGAVARPSSGAGVEIDVPDHGSYHQSGTKHMVTRKILPDGSALPKTWQDVISTAVDNAFAKALK